MADFHALNDDETLALRRYELAARHRRRFKLLRLAAYSSLRLIDTLRVRLDPRRSGDARALGLLAERSGSAYGSLAGISAAVLYAHRLALRTLRATGIRRPR